MHFWVVLLFFLMPGGAQAQIFKWTDKNGQVHYSQNPPPGQSAGAVDIRPSQLGESAPAPPLPADVPASGASRPGAPASGALVKSKPQPTAIKSLSGGKSDESDEARCNFARDILSGAVKRVGRRGPIDDNDRAVAHNDIQMFCH